MCEFCIYYSKEVKLGGTTELTQISFITMWVDNL